jgi:hypothetical protein
LRESEELAKNSGATLIEVGTDHRLADPEALRRLLGVVKLAVPTLCLGIDVTWWGGSPKRRHSQRDTIVFSVIQAGTAPDLRFSLVDLSAAPNPCASPTQADFDADGKLLVNRVAAIGFCALRESIPRAGAPTSFGTSPRGIFPVPSRGVAASA